MKRTIATLAIALAATLTAVAPAQAEYSAPETIKLSTNVMCVHPDFTVTGSGWKVHKAVAAWNAAQQTIRLTTVDEPGCAMVYVHRYSAEDGQCAYTLWDRVWPPVTQDDADGRWLVNGADIYLNDLCHPGFSHLWSRWTVAHELGHALGLAHNTSTRSVMSTNPVLDYFRPLVAPVDARDLAVVYSI